MCITIGLQQITFTWSVIRRYEKRENKVGEEAMAGIEGVDNEVEKYASLHFEFPHPMTKILFCCLMYLWSMWHKSKYFYLPYHSNGMTNT